jgi:hypothetical protein
MNLGTPWGGCKRFNARCQHIIKMITQRQSWDLLRYYGSLNFTFQVLVWLIKDTMITSGKSHLKSCLKRLRSDVTSLSFLVVSKLSQTEHFPCIFHQENTTNNAIPTKDRCGQYEVYCIFHWKQCYSVAF